MIFESFVGLEASPWARRWSPLVRPTGSVLDIACGQGRHMQWFAERQHTVTGIDRSPDAIAGAARWGRAVLADIEKDPWPLCRNGQILTFDAVVVTNYLWRALFGVMRDSLAPGGILIYETFACGNETVGKPSNPDFLLQPGELLHAFPSLHVVAFEEGFLDQPARFVQRLVAVRAEDEGAASPRRYPL